MTSWSHKRSRKTNAARQEQAPATIRVKATEFVPKKSPRGAEVRAEGSTTGANARFARWARRSPATELVDENPGPAWACEQPRALAASPDYRSAARSSGACAHPTAWLKQTDSQAVEPSTCAWMPESPTAAAGNVAHPMAAPSNDETTQATRTNAPCSRHLPQFPPSPHSADQPPAYSSKNAATNHAPSFAAKIHPAEFSPLSQP